MALTKEDFQKMLDAQSATLQTQLTKEISAKVSEKIGEASNKINQNIDEKVGQITGRINELEGKIQEQANKIESQEKEINEIKTSHQEFMKEQQIDARKRNIIIHNVDDKNENEEELRSTITNTIKAECNIDIKEHHFDIAFRMGKFKEGANRPILLALTSLSKKQEIFKTKKDMKNIGISEDMPKCVLDKRKLLRTTFEECKQNGCKVYFKQDKLIVNGQEWQPEHAGKEQEKHGVNNKKIMSSTSASGSKSSDNTGTPKRNRETENTNDSPNPKKSIKDPIIVGINQNQYSSPRGPKSIQQKLTSYASSSSSSPLNRSIYHENQKTTPQ